MTKKLVIVESPSKVATIKKYLGADFTVLASYGHVRDLIPKSGAVDTEHDFIMHYEIIKKNTKHVAAIAKALKESESFYLATDPDREGEAIAWHVYELMLSKNALKKQPIYRIVFNEITKSAIADAMTKPRDISKTLVDAQQARRALDYLVGFNLSPLLWKKVRYGLSAGRVQSPALRLIVTREDEIEKFLSKEYWTITAKNLFVKQEFNSKLIEYQYKKITQFSIINEEQAIKIRNDLFKTAHNKLRVIKVDKKQRKRNPVPPFTTSTLQQEAARKLGFSAKRTMMNAQGLYEAGYITYIRTDSVNLAMEAIVETRAVIQQRFGEKNLPQSPNFYKTKSKNVQEAHEAIRPTSSKCLPKDVIKKLNPEQVKLYNLIWKRMISCQMVSAVFNVVAIDLDCGAGNVFRTTGSVIVIPGFLEVYHEDVDDVVINEEILPPLQNGDVVELLDIATEQHFTEPPPRYSEASIIKTLEEYGIGRPSTYATIIDTLINRKYVVLENKRFKPTDVGVVVNKFLVNYFTQYVDYGFTAHLEDELDNIANGNSKFLELMKEFWVPFKQLIDEINGKVRRSDVTQEILAEKCTKCGKSLTLRLGKNGRFIGCSGYPDCDYTASVDQEKNIIIPEIISDRTCPKCGSFLNIKMGRYGKFIGCSSYPSCKFIESLEKSINTGVICPVCNKNTMSKRKSRYGKYFYSCANYPECKYAVWNEPLSEKCPKCDWKILTLKITKRHGTEKICPQNGCGYVFSIL
ncbi:MAG: type I DNA topoisomerase [Coxiellaceae bacterium]|jgi:DNA topoisomerase-1|nr:type I DNA topoisomerase [Coxiellaceae bacterium]